MGVALHEALVAVPFALNGLRAIAPLALLGVARDHPSREPLLTVIIACALASDLVDGAIARALGITGWECLYWTDHLADFTCVVGTCFVLSRDVSLARDLGPGRGRGSFVPWSVASVVVGALVAVMICARALGRY